MPDRRREFSRSRGARPRARDRRAPMPAPSSLTRISRRPPASIAISMRRAPASSAFSTSSFTAAAGRSTTSPAAMRSTSTGSRRRIGMGWLRLERELSAGACANPATHSNANAPAIRQTRPFPPCGEGVTRALTGGAAPPGAIVSSTVWPPRSRRQRAFRRDPSSVVPAGRRTLPARGEKGFSRRLTPSRRSHHHHDSSPSPKTRSATRLASAIEAAAMRALRSISQDGSWPSSWICTSWPAILAEVSKRSG